MSRSPNSKQCKPEVWGGIECTINRLGDKFRDQLEYTGHYWRYGDIESFAKLGITHLRYPMLWERHQASENTTINWSWAERQLKNISSCGMMPIVGLLHHGSGPGFTNLLDDAFPEKFARYAKWFAMKFPWITHYIPVNEPLTTARFSCLYGHWYPHSRSDSAFCRALINELKATVLAIKEIRKINRNAVFIQTEDLAKIHSTDELKYQADFENHRRWLTYDLLCGKVDQYHPLWNYLTNSGVSQEELKFFTSNVCMPDVIGLNYYVTSERFLDHNVEPHQLQNCGGNGKHRYMDKEAYRAGCAEGVGGLVSEAFNRYQLPVALTEVHIGCTPDEQIRWLMETWDQCCFLKQGGVDVRAITAWSLLGAYDWDSLLTNNDMRYECGAYDARDNRLKMKELGMAIQSLARTGTYSHPWLETPGWWRMAMREQMIA